MTRVDLTRYVRVQVGYPTRVSVYYPLIYGGYQVYPPVYPLCYPLSQWVHTRVATADATRQLPSCAPSHAQDETDAALWLPRWPTGTSSVGMHVRSAAGGPAPPCSFGLPARRSAASASSEAKLLSGARAPWSTRARRERRGAAFGPWAPFRFATHPATHPSTH